MARKPSPRVAGRRLRALARLLRTPVAGRRIVEIAFREIGMADLPKRSIGDAPTRPVIAFRVGGAPPAGSEAGSKR